ncbi:MAG: alpha/beta fold hydrolase [Planctomycetota bacterium]|nr:alpha/beta fold hydrolase [Planctomycetota bacterium]
MRIEGAWGAVRWMGLCLAGAVLAGSAAEGQDAPAGLAGHWGGDLALPGGGALEMVFLVERDGDGWKGTADTPAQAVFGTPLAIEAGDREDTFRLAVPATGGAFVAELAAGGDELHGHWEQRGARLALRCERRPLPRGVDEAASARLRGTWEGVLEIGPVELRIVLELEREEDGRLGGHMVSPDQSPLEIPITRVDALPGDQVRICVGSVFVTFSVALDESERQLSGTYRQGGRSLDVTLARVEEPTVVRRPQEPTAPFPYGSEQVRFENAAGGVHLAGTLTIPEGEGPFPAVLLISGSGAQDRDETIFQHKPFWVIADHLSRRGIAVLRVDDRGMGESTAGSDPAAATTEDFVGDALAGVGFLASREEIAGDRIGLVGHSEGGVIAPLAAVRSEQVAFIVLLAGPGVRGDELLLLQVEALGRAEGLPPDELERSLATQRTLFEILLDATLTEPERVAAARATLEASPDLSEGEQGEGEVEAALAQMASPWVRWFVRHDPAPVLERVRCPLLAVNGTLDLQVPSAENLAAIEAALVRGAHTDYEVRAFEGLNHLFQHCATGQVKEYGKIEETFALDVLELLAGWIEERFVTDG